MPTPVGHSLAAAALQLASGRKLVQTESFSMLAVFMIASLPDIDFLPGYFVGDPRTFHWGPTHSLFAAVVVGVIAGWIARRRGIAFAGAFALASLVYASHLLLDMFMGPGPRPITGLQILWPFSQQRWMMPVSIFRMAPDTMETIGPLGTLFSRGILPVIGRELLVLLPVVGLTMLVRPVYRRPRF
jgi:membrane-bound metal-dependent hydrolase YbcI (DUF457 family)